MSDSTAVSNDTDIWLFNKMFQPGNIGAYVELYINEQNGNIDEIVTRRKMWIDRLMTIWMKMKRPTEAHIHRDINI